jgi:hypothetical protein
MAWTLKIYLLPNALLEIMAESEYLITQIYRLRNKGMKGTSGGIMLVMPCSSMEICRIPDRILSIVHYSYYNEECIFSSTYIHISGLGLELGLRGQLLLVLRRGMEDGTVSPWNRNDAGC